MALDSKLALSADKEVVQEGRSKTLQSDIPESSLRDQIPKKLLKKVKDLNIANTISSVWHTGNADSGPADCARQRKSQRCQRR